MTPKNFLLDLLAPHTIWPPRDHYQFFSLENESGIDTEI